MTREIHRKMREEKLFVTNRLGLHARAAAQLVRTAGKFTSKIVIHREDTAAFADARSILSLLTLAASMGTELSIKVIGEDEDAAVAEVAALFKDGFGEV